MKDITIIKATTVGYVWHTGVHVEMKLDRALVFIYERVGDMLFAHDGPFVSSYAVCPGTTDAFAGAKFDIPLVDGDVIHAHGQVWSSGQQECADHFGLGHVWSCSVNGYGGYCNVDVMAKALNDTLGEERYEARPFPGKWVDNKVRLGVYPKEN